MRKGIALTIFVVLSVFVSPSPVWAQTRSEAFAAASQAFNDGDYLSALAYFEDAREAGVHGPAVHYNIAVCHYRLENYAQAEMAFRSVANRYPNMRALAQYNLGLVLLRQNRESEARSSFEQARQSGADEKVVELATAMLRRLDPSREPAAPPPRWFSFVDFNLGHDDNVALLDDSSLPAGQSVDSAFTEALAVISSPLVNGSGFRFNGSAYAVRYDDAGQFDQTALRLAGAYHWMTRAWRMEAGPHFNYATLDGDGFEQRLGIGVNLKRYLSSSTVFGVGVIHDEVDGAESQFAYLDGSREQLDMSVDKYGSSGRLTFAYKFESNDRTSASVSPTRHRLSLRYRYTMSPAWNADVALALRSSAYDDLAVPRDEDLTELSLGLLRTFAGGLLLNGTHRWSDNSSNVDAFTYTRSRISLGLTKTF